MTKRAEKFLQRQAELVGANHVAAPTEPTNVANPISPGLKPIRRWCRDNSLSAQTAYREVGAGRLVVVKVGSRTYVTPEADRAWRDTLPRYRPQQAGAVGGQVSDDPLKPSARPTVSGRQPSAISTSASNRSQK
jgi:hypothetical protein